MTSALRMAEVLHQNVRIALTWISILSIVLLALLVTISVAGRGFFGMPIPDDVVLAEGLLIATIMLPLAAVQADSGHLRVELIGQPGSIFTQITDRIGTFLGAVLFFTLSYAALKSTVTLYASGEFYQGVLMVPIWPTKLLFGLGALALAIELAIHTVLPAKTAQHPQDAMID